MKSFIHRLTGLKGRVLLTDPSKSLRLGNVENPIELDDAATKDYVDTSISATEYYYNTARSYTSIFSGEMDRQNSDVNALILGDSTTDETWEWPTLWAADMGKMWKTHTVRVCYWNDTTKVYGAFTTLQTGSGARTLSVYIGGASGRGTGWFMARDGSGNYINNNILPNVTYMHLVMVTYGLNDNVAFDTIQKGYKAQMRYLVNKYPLASFVCVLQHPKAIADANYSFMFTNAYSMQVVCANMKHGFVNNFQRFFDYGDYASAFLSDTLHLNAAGSRFFADGVSKIFKAGDTYNVPMGPEKGIYSFTIPVGQLEVYSGTPVKAAVGTKGLVGYAMPHDAAATLSFICEIPYFWRYYGIDILWTANDTTTGVNVKWMLGQGVLDDVIAGEPTIATYGPQVYATPGVVGKVLYAPVRSVYGFGDEANIFKEKPVLFTVYRDYLNASDTYNAAAYIVGIRVYEHH
jgi:hypothetical protein